MHSVVIGWVGAPTAPSPNRGPSVTFIS